MPHCGRPSKGFFWRPAVQITAKQKRPQLLMKEALVRLESGINRTLLISDIETVFPLLYAQAEKSVSF